MIDRVINNLGKIASLSIMAFVVVHGLLTQGEHIDVIYDSSWYAIDLLFVAASIFAGHQWGGQSNSAIDMN
jgi:hypothetical protein